MSYTLSLDTRITRGQVLNLYWIKPRPRGSVIPVPPATEAVRMVQDNRLGGVHQFPLARPFVEYLRELNIVRDASGKVIYDKPWHYISVPNAGIFNRTENPDGTNDTEWYEHNRTPVYNCAAFDGNVVNVLEDQVDFMIIETIDVSRPIPNYTFWDHPWLVHEFTSVTSSGLLRKAGSGLFVQVPIFTQGPGALPSDILEKWTPDKPPLP